MEQKTKYIDSKKLLENKEKISATIPRYIYDDLKAFSDLTGLTITEIVTDALFKFFRNKIVTNDYLLGYGNLFFKLPLSTEFKSTAIANRIKLNTELETTEPTEPITIATVTNNLDVFNGSTYYAGSELEKRNIKHIGLDFAIFPTAIKPTNKLEFNKLDIAITDALYVFYYEISSVNNIDVYLINPIDAVNKLAGANSIKTSEKLVSCLQDLENIQNELNKNYADEMKQLHSSNKYVSNSKEFAIKDKYNSLLLDVLTEIANKYNNPNIKIGSDATTYNLNELKKRINQQEQEQERIRNIIEYQENQQK